LSQTLQLSGKDVKSIVWLGRKTLGVEEAFNLAQQLEKLRERIPMTLQLCLLKNLSHQNWICAYSQSHISAFCFVQAETTL
jgi:hypothetical protein